MNRLAILRPEHGPEVAADRPVTIARILDLTRLRAQRLALWMERVWQSGGSSPDQGLAITAGEVNWLLAGGDGDRQAEAFFATDARAARLSDDIRIAHADLVSDPVWARLVATFGLTEPEADLLILAAAAEADPSLQRVIAYLNDDTRHTHATPQLSRRLAARLHQAWEWRCIRRWRLASTLDGAPMHGLMSGWAVDPALMSLLQDGVWRDPVLEDAVRSLGADDLRDVAPLHEAALDELRACADLSEVEIVGPKGVGRTTLAARYAVERGQTLLAVDTAALLARGVDAREIVTRALRKARFDGAVACFCAADDIAAAEWTLGRTLGVGFLRTLRESAAGETVIALAPLAMGERMALWRRWSDAPHPNALITHRLTPLEIRRIASASQSGGPVRFGGRRPDHALLSLLPCPYDWEDLVLPGEVDRALRDFADQIRLRWSVYDEWGFGRLAHLGYGVAALFAGPSGTGKTMAAQVIARSLGLDLYRVDLAGVVNKYVGETEKRLREVFDACEHSGALLFFDEADALFGGRMQVKDAHDRFANIETNYLLQRIETFDGVAILATNRRNDIDQAFVRRLRFIIEFLPPRPDERLALWRRALHPRSPSGEPLIDDIDFGLLAERLQMTGAEIKNTVLAAAFLAKAQGARITMTHVLSAAEREMTKQRAKLPVSLRGGPTG